MAPTKGKGMPTSYQDDPIKSMTFQDQYSANGEYALWMHDRILLPVITVISLFVLGLLLYVVVRFNRRASPVASRTTHNTMIEVVWTIVPVIILVVIAVPSITLLARQYETPPADAGHHQGDGLPMVLGLHLSRPRRDRNRVEHARRGRGSAPRRARSACG